MALENGITPRLSMWVIDAAIAEAQLFGLITHLYKTQPGGPRTPVFHVFVDHAPTGDVEHRYTAAQMRRFIRSDELHARYVEVHRRYWHRTEEEQALTDQRPELNWKADG